VKRLRELTPLAGKLETITAMDFRRSPGEILDSVQFGKTFVITKQGKPVALLTQLPGQTLTIVVDKHGKYSYAVEGGKIQAGQETTR
jgi:antitoxin (DNA-binding transcriptional repressor) of toxin-antitoxin stability system